MRWIRLIAILALFTTGCGIGKGVTFDWWEGFFPDKRPLHEQYPPGRPISAGKSPKWATGTPYERTAPSVDIESLAGPDASMGL